AEEHQELACPQLEIDAPQRLHLHLAHPVDLPEIAGGEDGWGDRGHRGTIALPTRRAIGAEPRGALSGVQRRGGSAPTMQEPPIGPEATPSNMGASPGPRERVLPCRGRAPV